MIYQKKMCIILPLLGQQLTVMKIDKKNHLQVYLEECKYKVKKKMQMSGFINSELNQIQIHQIQN